MEPWNDTKLTDTELNEYHKKAIAQGSIITVSDGDYLVGYVEFYLNEGVCYIYNLFIREEYRCKKAIWMLKHRLFQVCGKCKIYLGERNKLGSKYTEAQIRR